MVPPSQPVSFVFHSDQIEARKSIDKIIAQRKYLLLSSPMKFKKIASSQSADIMNSPSQLPTRDLSLARTATMAVWVAWIVASTVGKAVKFIAWYTLVVRSACVTVSVARSGGQSDRRLPTKNATGCIRGAIGKDELQLCRHFCKIISEIEIPSRSRTSLHCLFERYTGLRCRSL